MKNSKIKINEGNSYLTLEKQLCFRFYSINKKMIGYIAQY